MQTPTTQWITSNHAIIVCGHAVYTGPNNPPNPHEARHDRNWHLQPFQKGEGHHYIRHIHTGVTLAATDPNSLLIFSGGQTRHPHHLTEAQSYFTLASTFNFWNLPAVEARTTTEDFARDSFDNVLFGIARFRECVGSFPQKLSIISWTFKQKRFRHHVDTIAWPSHRFNFVGVGTPDDLQSALTAEARTLTQFKEDATGYGSNGGSLGKKKLARNPYRRQHGYHITCPSMTPLLDWRECTAFPSENVPWKHLFPPPDDHPKADHDPNFDASSRSTHCKVKCHKA